jgi:hypothetical protein
MALTYYSTKTQTINGEDYVAGDTVWNLDEDVAIRLLRRGLIIADGTTAPEQPTQVEIATIDLSEDIDDIDEGTVSNCTVEWAEED